MTLELIDNVGTTLGPTQSFLLTISGVLSARVWKKDSHILARLIIDEDTQINAQDIQQACLKELGQHATPQFLLLEKAKTPSRNLRLSA